MSEAIHRGLSCSEELSSSGLTPCCRDFGVCVEAHIDTAKLATILPESNFYNSLFQGLMFYCRDGFHFPTPACCFLLSPFLDTSSCPFLSKTLACCHGFDTIQLASVLKTNIRSSTRSPDAVKISHYSISLHVKSEFHLILSNEGYIGRGCVPCYLHAVLLYVDWEFQ